jgi:branched-chain amino acid transport system substrate-binding protein
VQRTVNRALIPILIALHVVTLAGCEPAPPRPVPQEIASPVPEPSIIIAALLDVQRDSGPNSLQRLDAARLAIEKVNQRGGVALPSGGHRSLELVVYDDAGDPTRAEAALGRIVRDGVVAAIGPSDADSAAVIRPAAETAGIPLIALDDASSDDTSSWRWTFSVTPSPEEALAATIDFFRASSVDRLAWLAPRTMAASTLRRTLGRLTASASVQIVSEDAYAPGEEDHLQRLVRLQAAEPRVILAWPRDSHEAAAIAREAGKSSNLVPVFVGPGGASLATLDEAGDAAAVVRTVTLRLPVADDLWDHDALTPVIRDFRREMQNRTGRPPTAEAAGAWDAVHLIVGALERSQPAGALPTRASVREGLESTTDYAGASGLISFRSRNHSGLDRRALIVARSEGRRWRLPP